MQFPKKQVAIITLLWIGFMVLLSVLTYLGRQKIGFLLFSGCMAATSFLVTKFYERRDVIERFGLQRNNALGLIGVIYFGLTVLYYFGIYDLDGVLFTPLYEEIFFRGYMLGSLCKRNNGKYEWRLTDLGWIIFTGFLFALSHIFVGYPIFSLSMWINIFLIFVKSWSIGFLYLWSRTIVWCFLVHMLHNLVDLFALDNLRYSLIIFSVIIFSAYLVKWARPSIDTRGLKMKISEKRKKWLTKRAFRSYTKTQ